jgi:hypothetical protein
MTKQWPTLPVSVAGAILTVLSVILLLDLKIEADVYGLLGQEDEAVKVFDQISNQTPGLEELLIICDTGFMLDRPTLAAISSIDGVKEHARSFLEGPSRPFTVSLSPSTRPTGTIRSQSFSELGKSSGIQQRLAVSPGRPRSSTKCKAESITTCVSP